MIFFIMRFIYTVIWNKESKLEEYMQFCEILLDFVRIFY